jgi:hypothetical protein
MAMYGKMGLPLAETQAIKENELLFDIVPSFLR